MVIMILLSKKLLVILESGVKYGQVCHIHPYKWNQDQGCPILSSKRGLRIWFLNLVLTFSYLVFVIWRNIQMTILMDKKENPGLVIYMQFATFYNAFPSIFQMGILLEYEAIPIFVSQYLKTMKQDEIRLTSDDDNEIPKLIKKAQVLLQLLVLGIRLSVLGFIGAVCVRSNSPEYLSSLIPSEGPWRIMLLIPCLVFHSYFAFIYSATSIFLSLIGLTFLFPAVTILQVQKSYLMNPGQDMWLQTKWVLKMYNSLRIFIISFNLIFGDFLIPSLKLGTVGLIIFCTHGAVRLKGFLAFFLGFLVVLFLGVLALCLIYIAEFHSQSTDVLRLLKSPDIQKLLSLDKKKMIKSFSPLAVKIRHGGYYIDKTVVLTVFQIILVNSINFLLTN